jgi:oligoribonuclease
MTRSKPQNRILWVDLEATGLDTDLDEIIEIGSIITDPELNMLGTFRTVVRPTAAGLDRLLADEYVTAMHTANGLLQEVTDTTRALPDIAEAQGRMISWMDAHRQSDAPMYLAGSGVSHFDDDMIARLLPEVAERLHYAALDVGVLRRFHLLTTGSSLVDANDRKTHRAMDDVSCHLEEARAFALLFRTHARFGRVDAA